MMSFRQGVIQAAAASATMMPMLMAGCAVTSGDASGARLSDNFEVYAPFDNERDWGPSYLVGAPYHHFGDDVRIDDTRSVPSIAAGAQAADPNRPPLSSGADQAPPRAATPQ